jgi:hypothetical protein
MVIVLCLYVVTLWLLFSKFMSCVGPHQREIGGQSPIGVIRRLNWPPAEAGTALRRSRGASARRL